MRKTEAKERLKVSTKQLFSLAEEMFDLGKTFIFTVTGNSMYPLLRHEIDRVELKRATRADVAVGDIVLATDEEGAYVLHRVYKLRENDFLTWGDGLCACDKPFRYENIVGKVITVYRRDREIGCDEKGARAWVRVWTLLRPVRGPILSAVYALQTVYHAVPRKKGKTT